MEMQKNGNEIYRRKSFIEPVQVFVKIYCELGTLHCLVCWTSNIFYLAAFSSQNWKESSSTGNFYVKAPLVSVKVSAFQ